MTWPEPGNPTPPPDASAGWPPPRPGPPPIPMPAAAPIPYASPATGGPNGSVPVPVQSVEPEWPAAPNLYPPPMQYGQWVGRGRRPGLVTAIGVISMVVGFATLISCFVWLIMLFSFYVESSWAAKTPSGMMAVPTVSGPGSPVVGAPPVVAAPSVAVPAASALPDATVNQIVFELRHERLSEAKNKQLRALLRESGDKIFKDSASLPMRVKNSIRDDGPILRASSDQPPGNFVEFKDSDAVKAGRLEIYEDHALFIPDDGSDTLRAMATDDVVPAAAPSPTTPSPATPAGPRALTAPEIAAVVTSIKSATGNKISPVQIATLNQLLSAPGQAYVNVAPGAPPPVSTAQYYSATGMLSINFNQSSLDLDAAGVVSNTTFSFNTTANSMLVANPFGPKFQLNNGAYTAVMLENVIAGALAIYLIVIAFMTLANSRHSRRLHWIFALGKLGLGIIAILVGLWLANGMSSSYQQSLAANPATALPGHANPGVTANGFVLVMGVSGLIYPVALLFALRAESVRNYFKLLE